MSILMMLLDEAIPLKPANTRTQIHNLFVDENAAAQKRESSGSDTDPDFYKLIGFDLDKARALKHSGMSFVFVHVVY